MVAAAGHHCCSLIEAEAILQREAGSTDVRETAFDLLIPAYLETIV
jgi:hypothetical protein